MKLSLVVLLFILTQNTIAYFILLTYLLLILLQLIGLFDDCLILKLNLLQL